MNEFASNRLHSSAQKFWSVFGLIVLVILIFWGVRHGLRAWNERPNGSQYQAVFLTNGNIYFGKLSAGNRYYVLKDIYYLQKGQIPQPKEAKEGSEPQLKLIKFGDEVHAPEDAMYIEKKQLLFWENIKDEGKVGTAIEQHKAQAASGEQK